MNISFVAVSDGKVSTRGANDEQRAATARVEADGAREQSTDRVDAAT